MATARQALIVCAPTQGSPLRAVGGLTLLERLLRQLSELGVDEILVVAAPGFPQPLASDRVSARVRFAHSAHVDAWKMVDAVAADLGERFLVVAGDLLVDQRLLRWIHSRDASTLLTSATGAPPELVGLLDRAAALAAGVPAPVAHVSITSLPTYSAELRGDVPLHLLRVPDEAAAARGWKVLLDHVEKRTKDLPATVFDPPFENLLVRLFAPTRITPNQVTVVTTLLGFVVAWLFWNGWLGPGIALAIAVEVLDGVDGKLARLKRMTSRVGEIEHIADFFYENSWYVGLGHGLAASGFSWAWPAALALCGFDLADNLAYLFYARRGGGNLDEATPFLRRFRLVAGRRNIYAWMLVPGILLRGAHVSFAAVAVWAGLTAALHWWRAVAESRRLSLKPAAPLSQKAPSAAATAGKPRRSARRQSRRAASAETQCQP